MPKIAKNWFWNWRFCVLWKIVTVSFRHVNEACFGLYFNIGGAVWRWNSSSFHYFISLSSPFYDCVLTIYVRTIQYNSHGSYLKDTNMSIITIWSVCSKWMIHGCLSQEKVGKSGSVSGWSRHLFFLLNSILFCPLSLLMLEHCSPLMTTIKGEQFCQLKQTWTKACNPFIQRVSVE